MKLHEFNLLSRVLKEQSGIELRPSKKDLAEVKLRPLLAELAIPSLSRLMLALTKPENERLRVRVAQTLAVMESYFFRDKAPFEYFADMMLPRLMDRRARSRRLRIWCAAASTGQEPYSVAMLLCDKASQLDGWNVEILATDFSEEALRKAEAGRYTQFEVQRGLPVSKLIDYFIKSGSGWQISRDVRDKVVFRQHNLLSDSARLGQFDVIFCRNVLIYFDDALRRTVLARLARQLEPDGYLVLGSAETTTGLSRDFRPVPEAYHGIFRLAPDVAAMRRSGHGPGDRFFPARTQRQDLPGSATPDAADNPAYRNLQLSRATCELLEAQARARGLTLAELLADYAGGGDPALKALSRTKTGTY